MTRFPDIAAVAAAHDEIRDAVDMWCATDA
jgi:hypothetical protein